MPPLGCNAHLWRRNHCFGGEDILICRGWMYTASRMVGTNDSRRTANRGRQECLPHLATPKIATSQRYTPLSPVFGGEGWDEGPLSQKTQVGASPLTLSLSPEYGGEGTGKTTASSRINL
jgi:hypothetical protein